MAVDAATAAAGAVIVDVAAAAAAAGEGAEVLDDNEAAVTAETGAHIARNTEAATNQHELAATTNPKLGEYTLPCLCKKAVNRTYRSLIFPQTTPSNSWLLT